MREIELERIRELSKLRERLMIEKKSVVSEEEISNYKKLLTNDEEVKLVSILLLTGDEKVVLPVVYDVFTNTVKVSIPSFYTNVKDSNQKLISTYRELEKMVGQHYYDIPLRCMGHFLQYNGFKVIEHEMWIAPLSGYHGDYEIIEKEKNIDTFDCTLDEALGLIERGYIDDINTVLSLSQAKLALRNFYQ